MVHVFDENVEKKDKFKTKAADPNTSAYLVKGLAFSPDSTKLAVAQSDNIVFVYRSAWPGYAAGMHRQANKSRLCAGQSKDTCS